MCLKLKSQFIEIAFTLISKATVGCGPPRAAVSGQINGQIKNTSTCKNGSGECALLKVDYFFLMSLLLFY